MSTNFKVTLNLFCDSRILELNGAAVEVTLGRDNLDRIAVLAAIAKDNEVLKVAVFDYSANWQAAVIDYGVRYSNLLESKETDFSCAKSRLVSVTSTGQVIWSCRIANTLVTTAEIGLATLQKKQAEFDEKVRDKETWIKEVNEGTTLLGYQEWVADRKVKLD